jgi:hypothetical protein
MKCLLFGEFSLQIHSLFLEFTRNTSIFPDFPFEPAVQRRQQKMAWTLASR